MLTTEQRERLVALRDDCWPNEWEAIAAALATTEKLTDALALLVDQHCHCADGTLDSFAESATAEAMRTLAETGRIKITAECGRRVIAVWKDGPPC